jgi:hypothetical protein
MAVELGREPTGETITLRELLEAAGRLPVTIGNEHGPWYVVLSSRPSINQHHETSGGETPITRVDLEVQFPDGGRGERLEVPVDQDVEVFE